jgi:hypothetical protein
MDITEFNVYMQAEPTDVNRLRDHNFYVHNPYGKAVARKNHKILPTIKNFKVPPAALDKAHGLDVYGYHQHGHLKLSVSEENPYEEIRRYDELREFDIMDMFRITGIVNLVQELDFPVMHTSIKTRHNLSDRLVAHDEYWEEYIFKSFYSHAREEMSFGRISVGIESHWEVTDERPGDFNKYVDRLVKMGLPVKEIS